MNENNLLEPISTEEACKLLGITRQTLYKLAEKGDLPGRKVGSRYKFSKKTVTDYIHDHENIKSENEGEEFKEWELRGDFATVGIKKMAKRTFQELASNIEELIVNAYDADATTVQIILDYDKNALNIIDDGNGMDEEALASYVIYGESNKTADSKSPKFSRSPIGEYGMGGKLAITNICKVCKIITKKDGKEHIFNMNRAELDKAKYVSAIRSKVFTKQCGKDLHGTAIYMEQLNAKTIDSDRLIERFENKMPKSQNFKIIMSIIKERERKDIEIEEPKFEYNEKFEYEKDLKLIGHVKLVIYFTKEPIPVTKQGVWTRVNGRIVNEKAEWFDLFRLTSGGRYRYRLFGYGEADGLKNFVTFAKNDFVDCPEYREYWDFGHKSISDVQNKLLKKDETAKKEQDRNIVKRVETEVNTIVSKLDDPLTLGSLEAKIKKEFTKEIENAPDNPYPNLDKVEEEAKKAAGVVTRGKDKRERRNQSLNKAEKMAYSGKNYNINTVDMSETGDLVKFTKDSNLIEINEKHSFYIRASKDACLDSLVRDVAFTEISHDYSEGNLIIFNQVYNELARLASKQAPKETEE